MNRHQGLAGAASLKALERQLAQGWLPRGHIDGLTLSNDTTDASNDLGIAAGTARSTANIVDGAASTLQRDQIDLELPIAIIKQLDVAFGPDNYDPEGYSGGDRSGGRSTSAVSNTSWHAILAGGRSVKSDVILHDGATQAGVLTELNKLGGFTAYRRLGSILRVAAVNLPFTQRGDHFELVTPFQVLSGIPPANTIQTFLTGSPLGVAMLAELSVYQNGVGTGIYLKSTTQADMAPSTTAAPLASNGLTVAAAAVGSKSVWTNIAGQANYRTNDVTNAIVGVLHGWRDLRGRDSLG